MVPGVITTPSPASAGASAPSHAQGGSGVVGQVPPAQWRHQQWLEGLIEYTSRACWACMVRLRGMRSTRAVSRMRGCGVPPPVMRTPDHCKGQSTARVQRWMHAGSLQPVYALLAGPAQAPQAGSEGGTQQAHLVRVALGWSTLRGLFNHRTTSKRSRSRNRNCSGIASRRSVAGSSTADARVVSSPAIRCMQVVPGSSRNTQRQVLTW